MQVFPFPHFRMARAWPKEDDTATVILFACDDAQTLVIRDTELGKDVVDAVSQFLGSLKPGEGPVVESLWRRAIETCGAPSEVWELRADSLERVGNAIET